MAKFTSKFPELGFYCCGELRKFSNGEYSTENKDEIAVLEALADVQCDCKPTEDAPKPKAAAKTTSKK